VSGRKLAAGYRRAAVVVLLVLAGCSGPGGVPPHDASAERPETMPAADVGLPGIALEIESQYDNNCARTTDGRVICWGFVFGAGQTFDAPIDEVAVGVSAVCLRTGTAVRCVARDGWPDSGVLHPPAEAFAAIAMGAGAACGITPGGDVVCWPGMPAVPASSAPANALRMSSSAEACALVGTLATCWPMNMLDRTRMIPGDVTSLALSTDARCGLTPAGEVVCDVGQCSSSTSCTDLGDWGALVGTGPPGPWVQIEIGEALAMCGVRSSGDFGCWGRGYDDDIRPAEPAGLRIVDLGLGATHACAVTTDHRVVCWGSDPDGEGVLDVPAELR
jgi:hypothetical protein